MGELNEKNEDAESDFESAVVNDIFPRKEDFDAFATSYILNDLKMRKICWEYPDEGVIKKSDIPNYECPFDKNRCVEVNKQYFLEMKLLQTLGPSERLKWLLLSSNIILGALYQDFEKLETEEELENALYCRAIEWCQVNKALFLDSRYPKHDKKIFFKGFSPESQKVVDQLREKPRSKFRLKINMEKNFGEMRNMDCLEENTTTPISQQLHNFFDELGKEISDMRLQPGDTKHWQLKKGVFADKKVDKGKIKKAPPFKRTPYPIKTKGEKLAELRAKTPKLPMETDELPGVWDPTLMIESFKITPKNYDSRILTDEESAMPISPEDFQTSLAKCDLWLTENLNNMI